MESARCEIKLANDSESAEKISMCAGRHQSNPERFNAQSQLQVQLAGSELNLRLELASDGPRGLKLSFNEVAEGSLEQVLETHFGESTQYRLNNGQLLELSCHTSWGCP